MINDCRDHVLSSAIDFLFELEPMPTLHSAVEKGEAPRALSLLSVPRT